MKIFLPVFLALTAFFTVAAAQMQNSSAYEGSSAYDFSFTNIYGEDMPLAQFQGQVLLVVNTASQCGYTPQYAGLQALWDTYREDGLVVIGVPSNDFGGQEPGSEAEIKRFCEVNFGINFPLAEKYAVRGPDAHPFYRWASAELGDENAPQWNFHKYLVDADGQLVAAFATKTDPMSDELRSAVEAQLPDAAGM